MFASFSYLLHTRVATRQLLPEVDDVMVVLFQVLLEVVAPEGQQRSLHLTVELWKQSCVNANRATLSTLQGALLRAPGSSWRLIRAPN